MSKKKPTGLKPKYRKEQPSPPPTTVIAVSRPAVAAPSVTRISCMALAENEQSSNQQRATATPAQERAAFALERIKKLALDWQNELKKQKEFNSYASAMPFMIHANGLGQTAAFYRRKGTANTYYELYKLLGDWLNKDGRPFAGKGDLLDAITQSDQDAYLAAQIEALLFLDWVKKLANAFLAREDDHAGDQQP